MKFYIILLSISFFLLTENLSPQQVKVPDYYKADGVSFYNKK